jgi:hypothetical protein
MPIRCGDAPFDRHRFFFREPVALISRDTAYADAREPIKARASALAEPGSA